MIDPEVKARQLRVVEKPKRVSTHFERLSAKTLLRWRARIDEELARRRAEIDDAIGGK